nr:MAG TPA: hypothetical protein [Caudoviricetes sp.]
MILSLKLFLFGELLLLLIVVDDTTKDLLCEIHCIVCIQITKRTGNCVTKPMHFCLFIRSSIDNFDYLRDDIIQHLVGGLADIFEVISAGVFGRSIISVDTHGVQCFLEATPGRIHQSIHIEIFDHFYQRLIHTFGTIVKELGQILQLILVLFGESNDVWQEISNILIVERQNLLYKLDAHLCIYRDGIFADNVFHCKILIGGTTGSGQLINVVAEGETTLEDLGIALVDITDNVVQHSLGQCGERIAQGLDLGFGHSDSVLHGNFLSGSWPNPFGLFCLFTYLR